MIIKKKEQKDFYSVTSYDTKNHMKDIEKLYFKNIDNDFKIEVMIWCTSEMEENEKFSIYDLEMNIFIEGEFRETLSISSYHMYEKYENEHYEEFEKMLLKEAKKQMIKLNKRFEHQSIITENKGIVG